MAYGLRRLALLVLLCATAATAKDNSTKSADSFSSTTRDVWPITADEPLEITTSAAWAKSVTLTYEVNYITARELPMTVGADGATWSATIPASAIAAGNLVRWAVSSGSVRHPKAAKNDGDAAFYGLIVPNVTDTTTLPVMEIYCYNASAPFSTGPESNKESSAGGKGDVDGCSLSYNGTFYDGVTIRRRGSSSLAWAKPKIKVKASTQDFSIPGIPYDIASFGLNSNWYEAGENTFTREPLVWDVFNRMGVPAVTSFQLHLRFRGAFFGRYSFVEDWSFSALKHRGFDTTKEGRVLWKSNSGWETNLRWDLARDQIMYYYDLESATSDNATALDALQDLTYGVAGGGELTRSAYLFDRLNLPQIINYMAAQTVILNQDRCTKNFDVYLEPSTNRWSILPWDVESGFGTDRGLNGTVAPDYCILACEQWNSPLYCDKDHPQDMYLMTATGLQGASPPPPLLVSAASNPYLALANSPTAAVTAPGSAATGGVGRRMLSAADEYDPISIAGELRRRRSARRLAASADETATDDSAPVGEAVEVRGLPSAAPATLAAFSPVIFTGTAEAPNAGPAAAPSLANAPGGPVTVVSPTDALAQDIEADFDEDLTKLGATALNSESSYNWLLDAVLSYPRTRAMYVRRLRTLMDEFTNGVFEERVRYWTGLIRDEAFRDNALWGNTGNPDYGRDSLLTEQLPMRKSQLYDLYGPTGPDPLIPGPDPGSAGLSVGEISDTAGGVVEILNSGTEAVDITGYSLEGVVTVTFMPGTVIPAGDSLYAVGNVTEFLAENGGKRLFSVGTLTPSSGSGLTLLNASGVTVSTA